MKKNSKTSKITRVMALALALVILAGCTDKDKDTVQNETTAANETDAQNQTDASLSENETDEVNVQTDSDKDDWTTLSDEGVVITEKGKYPITDETVKNLECYVTYGKWDEGGRISDALSSDFITLVCGQYPFLALSMENTEDYYDLFKTVQGFNDEIYERVTNTFDECFNEAKSMLKTEGSTYLFPFYTKSDIYAVRADSIVLSVVRTSDDYMGGVHPANGIGGYTYDTKTGKRLWIEDVFTDKDKLVTALSDELLKENPSAALPIELNEAVKELLDNKDTQSFTVNHTGVTFYFSTYVIAPYADGNLFATLSFTEYGDIINEKYMHIAEDYTCPIIQGQCFDNPKLNISALDLDNINNKAYYVNRGGQERVYYDKYDLDGFGGDFFEYEVRRNDLVPWIIHQNMYLHQNRYSEDSCGATLFTDPNAEFSVYSTLTALSYNEGCKKAGFDSEGYITITNHEEYNIAAYSGLTLKQDMRVSEMTTDENGKYTEFSQFTVIPKGMNVFFVKTDNKTYVDMFSDNGVYFRIYLDDYSNDLFEYIDGVERCNYFNDVVLYENKLLSGRWELCGLMGAEGSIEGSSDTGYEAYLNISDDGKVQYYFRDRNDAMHLTDNPNLSLSFVQKSQYDSSSLWPYKELENANWYAALSGTFCDEQIYMTQLSDGRLEMLINDNTKGSKYAGTLRLIFKKQ